MEKNRPKFTWVGFFRDGGNEFSNGRFKACGNYGRAKEICGGKLNWVLLSSKSYLKWYESNST